VSLHCRTSYAQVGLVLCGFFLRDFASTPFDNLHNFSNSRDNFRFRPIRHRRSLVLSCVGRLAVSDVTVKPSVTCVDWLQKKKVKCTLVQALRLCTGRTVHTGSRGIALFFTDHCTKRGWGVSVKPRPLFTPGKTRYPLYRKLVGPQGRSGQVRKISPPPGFDPRTVQPVASRYTDYVTRPTVDWLGWWCTCSHADDVVPPTLRQLWFLLPKWVRNGILRHLVQSKQKIG